MASDCLQEVPLMLGRISAKEKVVPGGASESVSVTVIAGWGRGVGADETHHDHVVVTGG